MPWFPVLAGRTSSAFAVVTPLLLRLSLPEFRPRWRRQHVGMDRDRHAGLLHSVLCVADLRHARCAAAALFPHPLPCPVAVDIGCGTALNGACLAVAMMQIAVIGAIRVGGYERGSPDRFFRSACSPSRSRGLLIGAVLSERQHAQAACAK